MSKESCECVKCRRNWLSDTLINIKNLLSRSPKYLVADVLRRTDSLIVKDNNGNHFDSNPSISPACLRTTYTKRRVKKPRNSRKDYGYAAIKKRFRNSPRNRSTSEEDNSSGSSNSSTDLRSPHGNRNILSRLVQYTFYSVLNTGMVMDQGTSASALCRSLLALYLKLDENSVYSNLLDAWDKAGQKIIVLKGYNHKHLQYLAKEVRHIAVDSNTLYRTTGQARVMLVLTAFGREEDMEEAFDDLCYLH